KPKTIDQFKVGDIIPRLPIHHLMHVQSETEVVVATYPTPGPGLGRKFLLLLTGVNPDHFTGKAEPPLGRKRTYRSEPLYTLTGKKQLPSGEIFYVLQAESPAQHTEREKAEKKAKDEK